MKWTALTTAMLAASVTLTACTNSTPPDKTTTPETTVTSKMVNIAFEKFTLSNGLEVIFHLDRSDPVVAVALTAHVGSAREKVGRTGFAHLFEHLLFLESENLGKGGLDKMSARIGGSGANGSTSRDLTNYYQTVPNDSLEKMIWAEADKLGFFINTVTEQVLAKEKQVVKNEKRQNVDNRPYGYTQYVIDKNLYPEGHPYNWQVIGSLQDLQSATLQDVKDFYQKWYVPNNVTLVIAGDFNRAQAKQWIHKYFDEIDGGEKIKPIAIAPISLVNNKKIVHQDILAKLPELTLTWPTIVQYHQDGYALDILTMLLTDGKKAPLNKVLIDQLKLTSAIEMYHYQSELAGQMILSVRGFEGVNLNKVSDALTQGLNDFETNGFSDEDLATIKAGLETRFYRGLSSVVGKGFQLAQYNIFTNNPGFINQDIENILAVTKDDIWRVYHQYIKNKNHIATSFVPKGQGQLALTGSVKANVDEEKIVSGAEQQFDSSIVATYDKTPSSFDRSQEPVYGEKSTLTPPSVWQHTLPNGLKIYSIENTEVPLVQLSINIAGGMLFDNPEQIGVANLVGELLNKGTAHKTPQQLEQAIDKLGATITIYTTREGINVQASVLARNYQPTMALISEMILQPRWDTDEFVLAKSDVLSQLKQQQSSPRRIAVNTMNQLIYGEDNILANNLLGTAASVNSIELSQLKTYYQNNLVPNLTKLHVVGAVSKEQIISSIATLAAQWHQQEIVKPVAAAVTAKTKPQLYFYDVPGAKQSQLKIGYAALNASDKDHYGAQVMNYILGGGSFASQLTQQLRESKGYTYGISSGFYATDLSGQFIISSGVRSNVTFEAIELIKQVVTRYQQDFSQHDLATTKSYYLKSNARRFETLAAKLTMLHNMSHYNLAADYVLERADLVNSLDLDALKGIAQQYLTPNKFIYLVVGDAKTQLERLNQLGLGEPILLNPAKK